MVLMGDLFRDYRINYEKKRKASLGPHNLDTEQWCVCVCERERESVYLLVQCGPTNLSLSVTPP